MRGLGVWGSFALLAMGMAACTPREPVPFQDAAWTTKGEPVVWQKLSGVYMEAGVFRYVDKENGVVVYLVQSNGFVNVTSQKVGK